jgi:2,4-dienoyl-CoA reductase-like NADH-dependent reductase (Old Yellow Enzyme family)
MSGDFMQTFAGRTGLPEPLDEAARRLEAAEFDLLAVGRALLADPLWMRKVREGKTDQLCPCEFSALAPSTAN